MGLLDKWNKNKFSIYKNEEKTVLKLIESLGKWLEDLIKVTDKKTDLYGDHKGTWQGYRPSQVDAAITSIIDEHTSQLEDIEHQKDEYNVMSIEGVMGDGINDDGTLITNFINTLSNNFVLKFPSGKTFKGNITIDNKKGVTLTGSAIILGTVYFKYPTPTYANNSVYGLKIQPYTERQSYTTVDKNCVVLENCRDIHFRGCEFKYGLYGITLAKINGRKHSGCMTIDSCIFSGCNYDLYAVNENYSDYFLMDTAITNCQSYSARISSVYVRKVDGLILSNNTFFMAGYDIKEPQKRNNIRVEDGNFISITGNNLFEAGEEPIYIQDFRNTVIANNNIAWGGQCKLSAGIKLKSTGTSNSASESLVRCCVTGNNIENASLYGILVEGYMQGLVINDNSILLNTGTYYYGNTLGNGSWVYDNLKAIKVADEYGPGSSITIMNNNYYNNTDEIGNYPNVKVINNLSKNGIVNRGYRSTSITDSQWGTTNINYSTDDTFSKNDTIIIPSTRTLDLDFRCIGPGINYKTIKVINQNLTNVIKIINKYSNAIYPFSNKDGVDIIMQPNSIREYMYLDGIWYEI